MADKIVAEQKAKDEEALALKKEEAKKAAFEKKKKEEEARIAKEEALKAEAERKRQEEIAAAKALKLERIKNKIITIVPIILGIILALAAVGLGFVFKDYQNYCFAGALGIFLLVIFTLQFATSRIKAPFDVVIHFLLAVIGLGLTFVEAIPKEYAIVLSGWTFLSSIITILARFKALGIKISSGISIFISGNILAIVISTKLFSGIVMGLVMGAIILITCLMTSLITKFSNNEYDNRCTALMWYMIIGFVACVGGVVMLFLGRVQTTIAAFIFVSSAILTIFYIIENNDDYIFSSFLYAIPVATSLLVLFFHWGIKDYVIKNNVLVHYYGTSDTLVVPDGVVEIGKKCTAGPGKKVKNVIIASSVEKIRYNAFLRCKKLENVEFANDSKLDYIGEYAFYDCVNLNNKNYDYKLVLPDSVTVIDSHAFGNTKFDSIVLGSSLKTINESVFEYCTNVKYIYYNGTSADWANVTKAETDNFVFKPWDYKINYQMVYLKS